MNDVQSATPKTTTSAASKSRFNRLAFPIGTVILITVCSYVQLWLVGALISFIVYLLIQIRKHEGLRQPEDSLTLRRIAFAAQAVSIIGLGYITEQIWFVVIFSLGLLAAGHYVAYRVRHAPPKGLRIATAIALHAAFAWMFFSLGNGQPFPQAQIAMLALAVVSFEMFSRLNLFSGLGIGMLNLYVAATLSRDVAFAVFLAVFIGLMLAFMWRADSEDGVKDNPLILRVVKTSSAQGSSTGMIRRWRNWGLRFGLSLAVFVPLIFIFTPHYAGHPIVPPISIQVPMTSKPASGIINPAIPLVGLTGSSERDSGSEYYYGFDNQLDLSYRGGLSDTLMMYVRSAAWSYWRNHAYDFYDGRSWSQANTSTEVLDVTGASFILANRNWIGRDYFVQTYYIAHELPNLIFTAGEPLQLYLAASQIARDKNGGIHVGEPLKQNTVYTVLSLRTDYAPDDLRKSDANILVDAVRRAPELAPFLQLPDTVTDRTRSLAHDLTLNASTRYDKVTAIRDYLRTTYPYDFFPPPLAPNADAVDQFLFEDKRGLCEQYASAMVIMLRSLGIPARIAAGFGSGTYNAITGYYEVHANDAHAWVETYFPTYGWVSFDPTPGWTGNPNTGPVQRWVFSSLFEDVKLPSIPFGEIFKAGGSVLSTLSRPLLVLAVLLIAGFIGLRTRKLFRLYRVQHPHHDSARRQIFAAYRRAQKQLKSRRAPAQTVHEHALSQPALDDLAEIVEIAAYNPRQPDPALVHRAANWRKKQN